MISKNTIKLIRRLEQKKYRQENKIFVVEGEKMVDELIDSSFTIQEIFATQAYFNKINNNTTAQITLVSDKELKQISQLKTPNQVLALAKIPDQDINSNIPENGLFIALDTVQDPGNMGTIIRTANWFGVKAIFCSHGCVDVFNIKVVQSTMGALFSTPVIYTDLKQLFTSKNKNKLPIYGTSLSGDNLHSTKVKQDAIIVMGNESKGLSTELQDFVDEKILIPTYPEDSSSQIESLNVAVACSIILAEFRRQA